MEQRSIHQMGHKRLYLKYLSIVRETTCWAIVLVLTGLLLKWIPDSLFPGAPPSMVAVSPGDVGTSNQKLIQ